MLLFFHKDKTTARTFPRYATIHGLYIATFKTESQQLLAVLMANTGTSTVDGDTEQLFRGQRTLYCASCVPTQAEKAFNFEIWFFEKSIGDIETKIYHVEKTKLGNPL